MEENLKPVECFTFTYRKKKDDLSRFVDLAIEKYGGISVVFTDNKTMVVCNANIPQFQGNDLKLRAQEIVRAANHIDQRFFKHDKQPQETSLHTLLESGLDRIHEPPAHRRQLDRDYGWE